MPQNHSTIKRFIFNKALFVLTLQKVDSLLYDDYKMRKSGVWEKKKKKKLKKKKKKKKKNLDELMK